MYYYYFFSNSLIWGIVEMSCFGWTNYSRADEIEGLCPILCLERWHASKERYGYIYTVRIVAKSSFLGDFSPLSLDTIDGGCRAQLQPGLHYFGVIPSHPPSHS